MASAVEVPATPGTPSPPPRVHTPQTPKFGAFGDSWEPYSPRKSARIANRTPSPTSAPSRISTRHKSTTLSVSTPGGSPQQKKRAPAMDSVRRATGATLTAEGAAHAAAALGIDSKSHQRLAAAEMLPTPSKTPRKLPDDKFEVGVEAVARNLFPRAGTSSDVVASPRKKKTTKKYTGISLESFRAEDAEEEITIYTDTRDRIPEVDHSAANPFIGARPAEQEPTKRRSARIKKVKIPGEGRVAVNDAVQRDDGAVYVFRGKTFWKSHDAENSGEGESATELSQPHHFTRSSIKPRLLFPPKQKAQSHNTDDEEAATDIEEHVLPTISATESSSAVTPTEKSAPGTPAAPRFAPASPPTTGRATRVSKRLSPEDAPSPAKRPTKSRSPFDTWRRSKSGSKPQGQKREAEAALPGESSSKRQRA